MEISSHNGTDYLSISQRHTEGHQVRNHCGQKETSHTFWLQENTSSTHSCLPALSFVLDLRNVVWNLIRGQEPDFWSQHPRPNLAG